MLGRHERWLDDRGGHPLPVRRRWDDGSLLRAFAQGGAFTEIEIPLRRPRPSEIGDDLGRVQTWVAGRVAAYDAILALTATEPVAYDWVVAQPLREISAPGVDTKFVERHRTTPAQLSGVPATGTGFLAALGLRAKPESVRLRFDPALGVAPGFTEATVQLEELAARHVRARTAVIPENEITFLTMPVPANGVVLWSKGFEVNRAGSLPWLQDADVHFWGNLDTHGFAILNQLRARLPRTRSFLMDRDTLLAHRERWGSEPAPATARLDRLSTEEAALYEDLVTDRFGRRVRLEQERIDWAWAQARLPTA